MGVTVGKEPKHWKESNMLKRYKGGRTHHCGNKYVILCDKIFASCENFYPSTLNRHMGLCSSRRRLAALLWLDKNTTPVFSTARSPRGTKWSSILTDLRHCKDIAICNCVFFRSSNFPIAWDCRCVEARAVVRAIELNSRRNVHDVRELCFRKIQNSYGSMKRNDRKKLRWSDSDSSDNAFLMNTGKNWHHASVNLWPSAWQKKALVRPVVYIQLLISNFQYDCCHYMFFTVSHYVGTRTAGV